MEMYNADGSRSEMCGNGIRCVAKYVYDKGLIDKKEFTIESYGKTKVVNIVEADSEARLIRIDMGEPELVPERIPVKIDHADDKVVDQPISADGRDYRMTCVSMGNPHAVIFLDPEGLDIDLIGPSLENHPAFPNRANIEFVRVDDRSNVHMRVWERGTGETLACGTGCCATAVSCILNGLTDRKVTVHVLGGDIIIEWNEEDGHVYMTGPAVTVFSGEIELQ
jgi:diaminopimelate epimerase